MKKVLFLLFLLLSGCATKPIQTVSNPDKISVQFQQPANPNPINTQQVTWHVYSFSKANLEKVILSLPANDPVRVTLTQMLANTSKDDTDVVLFTLDAKNYQNLALTVQDILRFTKDQKAIIIYYNTTVPKILQQFAQPDGATKPK